MFKEAAWSTDEVAFLEIPIEVSGSFPALTTWL